MAALDPKRSRFPKPQIKKPVTSVNRPRSSTTGPSTTSASSSEDAAEGSGAQTRTVLKRRRPVRRSASSSDDGFSRILTRLGVGVAFAFIALVARSCDGRDSGDKAYFRALVQMDRSLQRSVGGVTTLKSKVNDLPISRASDPKLRELHATLLSMVAEAEKGPLASEARMAELIARYDTLVDEVNTRYAR